MSDELKHAKDLAKTYETAIHGLRKSATIGRLVERIDRLEGQVKELLAENKRLKKQGPVSVFGENAA